MMLQGLMSQFQAVSRSLEASYAELQERVQVLSAELKKERESGSGSNVLPRWARWRWNWQHEIRNPLASIELYASMLRGQYAEQISRSVRLLNHTVSNTLQFGKPIHPIPERITVDTLLERVKSFVEPLAASQEYPSRCRVCGRTQHDGGSGIDASHVAQPCAQCVARDAK